MQGRHHPSVPVGSLGQPGMDIAMPVAAHGGLTSHQMDGLNAMQMQMMPNVSHSMGIPNPQLPVVNSAVPVSMQGAAVRQQQQQVGGGGGGGGMARGHGASGSPLYGVPDPSGMMMPISVHGSAGGGMIRQSGGGMIDLCDLQPSISAAPQVDHNRHGELQGLEAVVSSVQHDASFLSAVSARQTNAAAVAAVIRVKAALAQNPALLQAMAGRQHGIVEGLHQNQRVVVQAHKKAPNRIVGQEGIIVASPVNEWVMLRILQTGEVVRIHQRCLLPISHSEMENIPHDVIDNADLDALPDMDLLDGDIVLDTGMTGNSHHHAHGAGHSGMDHHVHGSRVHAPHEAAASFHDVGGFGLQRMEVAPPMEPVLSAEEQAELLCTMQADLLALEAKVPWVLAKLSWQKAREAWVSSVRRCSTLEECCRALQVLHGALHLPKEEKGGLDREFEALTGLIEAVVGRLSSGSSVATLLRQRWGPARLELERWLDRRSSGGQLAALEGGLLKAVVALEGAAAEGEEATLQVPLETMVGRNTEALSLLKGVLEREREELMVSKASLPLTDSEAAASKSDQEVSLRANEGADQASFVELLAKRLQLHRSMANGQRPGAEDDSQSEATDLNDSDMEDLL